MKQMMVFLDRENLKSYLDGSESFSGFASKHEYTGHIHNVIVSLLEYGYEDHGAGKFVFRPCTKIGGKDE